jgi:hypothetical protein
MEAEVAADDVATIDGAVSEALAKETGGADVFRVLIL